MTSPALGSVALILENARKAFVYSGYQLWTEKDENAKHVCGGVTSYWPEFHSVDAETFFDIGSVTKAVATTSLVALAVDQKRLKLEDTVGQYVKPLRHSKLAGLKVFDLLCHAAGLQAWLRVKQSDRENWPVHSPGKVTAYSDLGFLVLGDVVQAVWGAPIDRAFQAHVVAPLGMKDVQYGPLPSGRSVAATEVREGRPLQGIVFDENSADLGGRTPHAGLFATAAGLAPWAREWCRAVKGKSKWLSEETARRFTHRAERVAGSSWGLGWDTKSEKGSSAGALFHASSFGHLGYPGCSVWIDPHAQGFAIFLSNRVHPSRLDERIRSVRPLLHDAVARGWTENV